MLQSKEQPNWEDVQRESQEVKHLYTQWNSLEMANGVLYRRFERPDGTILHWQVVVPRDLLLWNSYTRRMQEWNLDILGLKRH